MTSQLEAVLVDADVLKDFARRVLVSAGASRDAAEVCAEVLVDANLCGTDTHGIARLEQYAAALSTGRVDGAAHPQTVTERGAIIAVDGNNCLGPLALRHGTDVAVRAARQHGLAAVTVRGSNHAGSMSWYIDRATSAGLFALVLSGSTKPMVAPTNGAAPFLGTNAVAYGAPACGPPLTFDAATSVVSRSRLEAYQRAGTDLPPGWAVRPDGRPAADAGEVIEGIDALTGHSLLPFGGTYGAHKGFGIGLLVELLCGPVAGGRWGRSTGAGPAGVGHFVLCLDLDAFGASAGEVEERIATLCADLRAVPAADEQTPVRLPGSRRRSCAARRAREGIPVPENVLVSLERAADLTNVEPLAATMGESTWPSTP